MIKYIIGDATNPEGDDFKVIIHCCNDIGKWGSGFVLALSNKWKFPETYYREWCKNRELISSLDENAAFKLGNIQYVPVAIDILVINMIGQSGIKSDTNKIPPIRYEAIRKCVKKVAKYCMEKQSSVHAPRFGAGLAGGNWNEIEKIINEELIDKGIAVTIYDFNRGVF